MLMGGNATKNEPHTRLFVTTSGTLFVYGAYGEFLGGYGKVHCFDGRKWSFQNWPAEANERDKEPVFIEALMNDRVANRVRKGLYDSFREKTDLAELVKALDTTPKDLKEDGIFPAFSSAEGGWDVLSDPEKMRRADELLR